VNLAQKIRKAQEPRNEYDGDWIVLLIGVVVIMLLGYAITVPAQWLGWVAWKLW
jgi:hypothetical protein